jgi:putative transposase
MLQRKSIRLKGYDYSSVGAYFVTLCTQNRECLFGEIKIGKSRQHYPELFLNDAGQVVTGIWNQITSYYPGIELDEFIVMPNHLHGIIRIVGADLCVCPGQSRGIAPTLPRIVQRFKTMTTKRYIDGIQHLDWHPFSGKLWQRNYYEHIIRNEDNMNSVREYIQYNVIRWESDEEYHV